MESSEKTEVVRQCSLSSAGGAESILDDGEVHYGGKKVKKLTQVVNIGLSIENIGLYDDMTVYQNMKYYAEVKRWM